MPVAFYHLTYSLLNLKSHKKILIFAYSISFLFVYFLHRSDYFITGLFRYFWGYYPKAGILHPFYLALVFIIALSCDFIVFKHWWKVRKEASLYKQRLLYIFLAFAIISFICIDFIPNYGFEIYPFGFVFVLLFVAIIAYAIVKYRLMDITLTITRTGIFVTLYTLVLGLPFILATLGKDWLVGLLGTNWWFGPLILMAVLATAGPFIYIFLQRRAEAILLREQRRYQDTLKQAAAGMTRIRDLQRLSSLIVHIVTRTVRISHSAIYLFEPKSEQYLLEAGRNLSKEQPPSINKDSSLIVSLEIEKQPLIYEEIKQKAQINPTPIFQQLEEQMRIMNASVLVPSLLENRLLGFLVLGDKRSGKIYTTEDLDVFSVLASQAALAIENAQFIQEAQAMQEQIAQAEKMATVGTMADGLSHQINNRLHALSMIAGDTLDTLKLANTENYTEEAKKILGEIKYALERIQSNVLQGRDVVSGLLKYSRKGAEGFAVVSMDEVLDGALEMAKFKVKLSEIDVVREYPPDLPKIKVNLTQLQEVFFNLIDNAYDAIRERKDTLKEQDFRGKVTITSEQPTDNFLRIIFEDNGIGVRNEDKRKVFTPFFTTKVSSRQGTGLGLFVIQRIINQIHQGEIKFESEYGKGTRFILDLPLVK